jgi:SAM-dependent methyltransferase
VVAALQAFPSTPPNHRQIHHPDLPSKFPFPSSHFSAVIVRFPPLLPDSTLRHLISEAKRVLLPGGYLELSVLDLDMLNMGNRCRRAVRNLKVKLSVANPDVSLASASDSILRHLGRRAFTEVKSCRVGVPVASIVNKAPTPANNGTAPSPGSSPEKEISLAELMRDESSAGDYGITKMVAKVGRWWYLRCYERTVITAGEDVRGNGVKLPEESIFADERVITECEKWGTSFKLMVCYARKPVLGRRRTLSI